MGTTLFLIDCQNDFIDDTTINPALPVPGSLYDMNNLLDLFLYHAGRIDRVVIALDQHPFNHIAHAVMWADRNGLCPEPFETVRHVDVQAGKWRASNPNLEAIQADYVKNLEAAGEVLTIWPPHCLIGTRGADIHDSLLEGLRHWWHPERELLLFPKSGNWQTEQYSSFKACVVVPDDPSTDFNYKMRDAIVDDQILVAGEALSFCVAASVMDAINCTHTIKIAERMVLLRDCTSPVRGFEQRAENFVDEFQRLGGRVSTSAEIFGNPAC
jgi:nicotinamidase/pyrazinamidase